MECAHFWLVCTGICGGGGGVVVDERVGFLYVRAYLWPVVAPLNRAFMVWNNTLIKIFMEEREPFSNLHKGKLGNDSESDNEQESVLEK